MSGNDTEGQPKKPAMKVDETGKINLTGKKLIKAIIGKNTATIFGEYHNHYLTDKWRGNEGFTDALVKVGITKVFPEFSKSELKSIKDRINAYGTLLEDQNRTSEDYTAKLLEIEKNTRRSKYITNKEQCDIASTGIFNEYLNYGAAGIIAIPADLDEKYKVSANKKRIEALEYEKSELEKILPAVSEKDKIAIDERKQNLLDDLSFLEPKVEIEQDTARETINLYANEIVRKNTTPKDKIILTWGMRHIYNESQVTVEQGDDLDEMLGEHFDIRNVVSVGVFGTRESYDAFEKRILDGEIEDAPDYAIVVEQGFGQEIAYSMKERIAYLKAEQGKLKEKQEREKAKPSKGGPNMGAILEQLDGIEIENNFGYGNIGAALKVNQRG